MIQRCGSVSLYSYNVDFCVMELLKIVVPLVKHFSHYHGIALNLLLQVQFTDSQRSQKGWQTCANTRIHTHTKNFFRHLEEDWIWALICISGVWTINLLLMFFCHSHVDHVKQFLPLLFTVIVVFSLPSLPFPFPS